MKSWASVVLSWPSLGVATVMVATLAATAWVNAEPGRRGPPGGGPPGRGERGFDQPPPPEGALRMGMMLRHEEVREELGVTDEQMQQIREAAREMRSQRGDRQRPPRPRRGDGPREEGRRGDGPPRDQRPRGDGPRGDGPRGERPRGAESLGEEGADADRPRRGRRGEGRAERGGRMRERFEEMRAEAEQRLGEILTEEQLGRLKQIELQQRVRRQGPRALTRGPLAEELGVSEEQGEQLREKAGELREALAQQLREVTDASRQELFNELTTEQRAKLDEMLGEPFDMPPPPERMGRRQGRPGRDGPPRGGPRGGGRPGGPPPRD